MNIFLLFLRRLLSAPLHLKLAFIKCVECVFRRHAYTFIWSFERLFSNPLIMYMRHKQSAQSDKMSQMKCIIFREAILVFRSKLCRQFLSHFKNIALEKKHTRVKQNGSQCCSWPEINFKYFILVTLVFLKIGLPRPLFVYFPVTPKPLTKKFRNFWSGSSLELLVANWKKYPHDFHWQRGYLALAMAVRLGNRGVN